MTHVVAFVNDFISSSIPVEISEKVAATTDVDVTIASFYTPKSIDPDLKDLTADRVFLDATGRFDFDAFIRLRRVLSDRSADVLHTHHNFSGTVARIAGVRSDVAVVDTEHNDHRYFSTLQNVSNTSTLPLADAVVANSESTRDSFRWYEWPFVSEEKLSVIYNGIDIERIDAVRGEQPPISVPSGPVITTAGSLTPQKHQETIIEALPEVLEQQPDATLIIIGTGARRDELTALAERHGVSEHVVFAGYLPTREDVYRTLNASDVFVIPSLYEGFCVAVVEAMACGLPVVASDISVLREVVGSDGCFAPVGSSSGFARQLISLLTAKQKRQQRGQRLRRRATHKFPLTKTAHEYATLYRRLDE